MSIEETKPNDNKIIFGGIFLVVIALIILISLGFFGVNCDIDYCTISDSVNDQIVNTRSAIGISAGFLLLFGILHVSARTEKMKKIVHSTMFSGAWANVLFPVLSLILLVSSIYLYTIVNEKNFVCSDDTGTTKSKRNSRYTSITTPINIMIGMSVLLLISSIIVIYNFWKKTDEERLDEAEKAKASLSKIDDKVIGEAPVSLYKKLDEIELSLSQAKGLYDDELDNAQVENLIESVKLKKTALNNAVSRKKADLESEKAKLQEVLSSQTNSIKRQRDNDIAMHDFIDKSDADKFEYFCKIKKEGDNPDLLKKLQATPFYKDNSKKLDDVCSISGGKVDLIEKRDKLIGEWHSLPDDNTSRINFLDKLCSKENQTDNIGKLVLEKLKVDDQIELTKMGLKVYDYVQTCSFKGTDGTILNLVERQKQPIKGPVPVVSSGPPPNVLMSDQNQPFSRSDQYLMYEQTNFAEIHPERQKQIKEGVADIVKKTEYCDRVTSSLKIKGDVHDKYVTLCRQLGDSNNELTDEQLLECFKNKDLVHDLDLDHFNRNCDESKRILKEREFIREQRLKKIDKNLNVQPPNNNFKPKLTKRVLKKH